MDKPKSILKKQVQFENNIEQNINKIDIKNKDKRYSLPLVQIQKKNSNNNKSKQQPLIQRKLTIKNFDDKFFAHLSHLEEKSNSRKVTLDDINQLIEKYSKCVEYYDSKKDPISKYFQDKIQTTLMNKKSLKLLFKTEEENLNTTNNNNKKTSKKNSFATKLVNTTSSHQLTDTNNQQQNNFLYNNDSPLITQNQITKQKRAFSLNPYVLFEDSSTQNSFGSQESFEMDKIMGNSLNRSTFEESNSDSIQENCNSDSNVKIIYDKENKEEKQEFLNFTQKKQQRSKHIQLYAKFKQQKEDRQESDKFDLPILVDQYEEQLQQDQLKINDDLDGQINNLKERLLQRKQNYNLKNAYQLKQTNIYQNHSKLNTSTLPANNKIQSCVSSSSYQDLELELIQEDEELFTEYQNQMQLDLNKTPVSRTQHRNSSLFKNEINGQNIISFYQVNSYKESSLYQNSSLVLA